MGKPRATRRPSIAGWTFAVATLFACGDDTSADTDTDTDADSATTSTSTTGTTGTTGTTASSSSTETTLTSSPSSASGTSSSGGSSSTTTGAGTEPSTGALPTTSTTRSSTESTTGAAPRVTADVQRYEAQPMVVDITLSADGPVGIFSLEHDHDPGVRISEADVTDDTATFRVRGLAPATVQALTFSADETTGPIQFATHAPLTGFLPSFEVTGSEPTARPFRVFDLSPFPPLDRSGIFAVDGSGTTRWYLGEENTALPGVESIWAALKLRDDGSILHLLDHSLFIRNEIGETLLQINDEDVGIEGLHHEVHELSNGNFLALSFSFQTVDYPGVGPTLTAGDLIVEFDPAGNLVWSWDAFDHLNPQRITEGVGAIVVTHPTTGESASDWTHGNGIEYDEDSGSILLSLRHQDWLVAIDHNTSAITWILGDGGDFTLTSGTWFYHQHSPQWQPDGSLLVYDNGLGRPGTVPENAFARAVRYEVDLDTMTVIQVWEDDAADFISPIAGDCDLNPAAGTYLVTDSSIPDPVGVHARVRELDPDALPMTQWSLEAPDGRFAYRAVATDRLVGEPAP